MKNAPRFYPITFLPCFFLALFSAGCAREGTKKACFREVCIQAEVADTQSKKVRGLMYRKSLAKNKGMLFIFREEDFHNLWMKNMRFPLDIIWLDRNKKIVDIYEGALPCKDICKNLSPGVPAQFVLEFNSGFVKENQIQVGESVDF